jgi:hypothetical protein
MYMININKIETVSSSHQIVMLLCLPVGNGLDGSLNILDYDVLTLREIDNR